jgi:hypothetical protein
MSMLALRIWRRASCEISPRGLARSMEHQNGHLGKHNLTHNRAFTIGREVTPKAVEQMEGSKGHGNDYSRP